HVIVAAVPNPKRNNVDPERKLLVGGPSHHHPRTLDEEVDVRVAAWSRTSRWSVEVHLDPGLNQGRDVEGEVFGSGGNLDGRCARGSQQQREPSAHRRLRLHDAPRRCSVDHSSWRCPVREESATQRVLRNWTYR